MLTWNGSLAFRKLIVGTPRPDLSLHGYPEYQTRLQDLDTPQRLAFDQLMQRVYASLSTLTPVRAVLVVGHADTAWLKPVTQRAAFELQVSLARARSAEAMVHERLTHLARHPQGRHLVKTRMLGLGATRLAERNASTEAQMRKNRRVEFVLLNECVGRPSCRSD